MKMHNTLLLALVLALSTVAATPALAQSTAPKVLKKVPLEFPPEAVRRGVDRGVLKARLTIDGAGAVTDASIVETTPSKAKILNDSVLEVLNKWKFEGSGKPATFDMQLVLQAD
ncbi:MAG: TonB family protein [Rubrivivax sp.]